MRQLGEALAGFRRAPLLSGLSVVAIGLALLVVGLFGLTARNIHLALSEVEARVEVVAYLEEGTRDERVEVARTEVGRFPEVERVTYVSKVEALYNASRELAEFSDVFSDLEVNPLPASLEVRLRPGYRTPEHVRAVSSRLTAYDFVEEVRFGDEWVDGLFALRRIAAGAALVLGGAFAGGAVLLIGIAVRVAILARAREIGIMQVVGATDAYIRRPFLWEGLLTGLGGGVLALGLTWAAREAVQGSLGIEVTWLPDSWVAAGLAAAALLGMAAAARAVRRELRRSGEY